MVTNRDQAVLGRKGREKQLSARERWEAHQVSLLGLTGSELVGAPHPQTQVLSPQWVGEHLQEAATVH